MDEEIKPCPNCKETVEQCACMRNICKTCGEPVGNITFTACDECWDKKFPKPNPDNHINKSNDFNGFM